MGNWEASRKAKESNLYPKSVGENVSNENQIPQPFNWEYNEDKTLITVKLKEGYAFNSGDIPIPTPVEQTKPPVGIPVFWFTSVIPDWALACDDGAGGSGVYDFADYPELDNGYFKQFLADFSDFGASDDTTHFTMPDLRGMFMRMAGTNGIYGTAYYAGGDVGDYQADQLQYHNHYRMSSTDDHYHGLTSFQSTDDNYSWRSTGIQTYGNYGNWGNETKPCSFSGRIIVRFE